MDVPEAAASIPLANATSLEVLKNLFEGESLTEETVATEATDKDVLAAVEQKLVEPVLTVVESAKAEYHASAAITAELTATPASTATAGVSRGDLVNVLESFVNLIKNSPEEKEEKNYALQNTLSFDPMQTPPQKVTLHVDDKTTEVEELRCLLVEAQETIIRLLTDRVEDRARISRLETELKLLPDLQTQADRALAVAMNTEDFRKELTKVKFELERVRLAKVRKEVDPNPRSFWRGMRGWLFKTNKI
ncbi:MAG TPA: hypothetical protein V6C81_06070 [Planktothrix sp.]|jgi:hypothetical protein